MRILLVEDDQKLAADLQHLFTTEGYSIWVSANGLQAWEIADVDKHRKGLGKSQRKKWVRIANGRLKTCLAEGGKDCEASAIKIANSVFEKGGRRKT